MRYMLLLTLLSFNAFADPYFGVSLGETSIDLEPVNLDGFTETIDDKGSGWRVFAGNKIEENLGFEVGYADAGKFSQTVSDSTDSFAAETRGTVFDLSLIGKMPIRIGSLFGRLGLYRAEIESDFTINGSPFDSTTTNSTGPLFGFGLEPKLGKISMRFEYSKYLDVENDGDESDADFISVGIVIPLR
jgi:OmpA-OmpF porin, OOP family